MDPARERYVKASDEAGEMRYRLKMADNLVQRGGLVGTIFGRPARWILSLLLPSAERDEKQARADAYKTDK